MTKVHWIISGALICVAFVLSSFSTISSAILVLTNPCLGVSYEYANVTLPNHFLVNGFPIGNAVVDNDNTPVDNAITNAGATLGRVLFYDENLSANGTISCASCHNQHLNFADANTLSFGFNGGTTRRHSPSLANGRYYSRGHFFWDERANTLEDQVLMPFQDPVEMGLTLTELVNKVDTEPFYDALLTDAFGDATATSDRISKALAQFVRSMVSYQSRYDEGRAQVANPNDPFPNFTAQENAGKAVFIRPIANGGGGCITCHSTDAFINAATDVFNIGLDTDTSSDGGIDETFPGQGFLGAFKVPSLRNIGRSAPYMHDGRFESLAEVIDHYNTGIKPHPNLSRQLTVEDTEGGTPVQLNLNEGQQEALEAFLHTLTDPTFLTDPKFSNPFCTPTQSPNFVFILTDDQGWNGTSVPMQNGNANSESDFYQTPALETLAQEGMVFSQAYAPAPKCSPSRNSILTGQSTARNQFTETGFAGPNGNVLIEATTNLDTDAKDMTIGEWLKNLNVNYRTAHYGKWHLGTFGTIANGFDFGDGETSNNDGDAANGMIAQTDPKRIFELSQKGMDFMDDAVTAGAPFYLQLSYYAVHTNIEAQQATIDFYNGQTVGAVHDNPEFAAMTQDLDTGMGQVLQKVKDLGIENNTYIIYLSDNGSPQGISSNGILTRGKESLYEGGIRVPMIVKGPGVTPNAYNDEAVVGYDLFPTIAELSGGTSPLPDSLDGKSLVPLFNQTDLNRGNPLYFHSPHYGNGSKTPRSAVIDGNYKLIIDHESCDRFLFGLDNNLRERDNDNILNDSPENLALGDSLTILLRDYLKSVGANMPTLDPLHVDNTGNGNDLDNDTLDDEWEFCQLLCAGYGPTDDPDGDGISNFDEMQAGTDPLNPVTTLQIKILLQGPYNGTEMTTDLQIPLTDPYGLNVTVSSIPADVVDWVMVEIRDPLNNTNILATRACFVRKDGQLLELEGSLGVQFLRLGVTEAYIVVRHRNHLGVMTENPIPLN